MRVTSEKAQDQIDEKNKTKKKQSVIPGVQDFKQKTFQKEKFNEEEKLRKEKNQKGEIWLMEKKTK